MLRTEQSDHNDISLEMIEAPSSMDINAWGTNRERGVSDGKELNANSSWEQIVIHREMQKNNNQKQVVNFSIFALTLTH